MNICPGCNLTNVEMFIAGFCPSCAGKYITKQDKRISELEAEVCPSWMGKEKGCNEARDVEKLETQLEQHRWIPVSERLPEKDINYTILAWSDNGEQCFVHEADCVNNKFFSMTGHEIYWITHWKPIILP